MNQEKSEIVVSKSYEIIEVDINDPTISRHYGNTIPIWFKQNGQPRYLLGPHYYLFFGASILTTLFLSFMLYEYSKTLTLGYFLACLLSSFLYVCMYIKIGFSVPGIASSGLEPDCETKLHPRYCVPCKTIKEPGTRHCLFCDVCIYNVDHHCPWIGKCVGRDNIIQFRMFVLSICSVFISFFVAAFGVVKKQE